MEPQSIYIARSVLFGLLWKVVLHADNYDRDTISYHWSLSAAVQRASLMNAMQ